MKCSLMRYVFLMACWSLQLCAQKEVEHSSHATFSLRTTPAGYRVYVDSVFIGITPFDRCPMEEGTHVLTIFHPNDRQWNSFVFAETLTVYAGEQLDRSITFPLLRHIVSEPYGVSVYFQDSLIGVTPLYTTLLPAGSIFRLVKSGFEEEASVVHADATELHIILRPLPGNRPATSSFFLSSEESKSPVPIYISTGATLLSGVAAAYWKTRADSYYADYRSTGDQNSLDRVHHFDLLSGIALVASEMSFLTLTYHLLSR